MWNRYEVMTKEQQEDLLREAQRPSLIWGLWVALRGGRSRLRDHPQKKTRGPSEIKSRSIQILSRSSVLAATFCMQSNCQVSTQKKV